MAKVSKTALAKRGTNRSSTPLSEEFMNFIGSNWRTEKPALPKPAEVAKYAAKRRALVAKKFAGYVVVIEAGALKARANDTDYQYRPHSAFAHLTGWGVDTVPDSALVIDGRPGGKHKLYFRPTAGHQTREFFSDPQIGEFWVGKRPTLEQVSALLGIPTGDISNLESDLGDVLKAKRLTLSSSSELAEFVSEIRLVKDQYEIEQMRQAVAATVQGFKAVARSLKAATKTERGERVVETAFYSEARVRGNTVGYDTIAASGPHACTLHWVVNNGEVRNGDLILVDAGVEVDSLYTADVTRTLPVNGKFSKTQKLVYEAVLEAADAVFAAAKPGMLFRDLHATAMKVIAAKVAEWGLIPIPAEDSLNPDKQFHRRYMVHGTSHHLGLDVHDCAQAKRELYMDSKLEPGMIFTIEPGLYFHEDDLNVPEKFRGIGVRIEDDVLVTKTGVENLSRALPRRVKDIEKWMANQAKKR